jgi:cytochrome P450
MHSTKVLKWRRVFGKPNRITDDMVARMLRTSFPAEVDFDLERVGVNISGLLIGAVETTARAVAQVAQYTMQDPERFAKAKDAARAADPACFDGMVWEALRFVAPFPYTFRVCSTEYTIGRGTDHATTIAPGTRVLALTQSAMFDSRAFNDPDAFIPTRNWYHYFHFGFGSHECLGKHVGMVMIPEMVRQLFLLPNLEAAAPIDYEGGPFPEKWELCWQD